MQRPIVKKILLALTALILVLLYTNYHQLESASAVNNSSQKNTLNSEAQSEIIVTAVVVAAVRQDSFNIYQFGLGTITPLNVVEVKSRVDGQLISTEFKEGTIVQAGDLLAQLDARPFEAQLKLARGQLAMNQALLKNADVDLQRYRLLLSQNSTSKQTVEAKESLLQQYQATVEADQGALARAQLQLQYTKIIAPISGRLGFRQVDAGNAVGPSSPNGIVSITQLNPISVVFPIPEDVLPHVLRQINLGEMIPVDIYDRSMHKQIATGMLLAVDNQIDVHTGTIKLKAKLANINGDFFANQFVNVRMPIETYSQATLIPTPAIQRGAQGTFVYVVNEDNIARVTPITISATQGEISAITTAIPAGTMVVTEGADRLRADAKVKLILPDSKVSDTNAH